MCRYVRISTTIYIRKRFFSRKPLRIAAHHDNILNAVRMLLKIPLGRFLRGTFFFRLWGIFCVQVSYCPAKGGNRAGSSMNEFDYSRRGTQTIFSLLDCRSCENFGLAHFSIFLPEKKLIKQSPNIYQFSDDTIENEPVRNCRNCDSREAEN